ncbi:DUF433 domain-containing protein [Methylocystis sp.]|uniref:DUF433 domain-containing protein n=1 Tax=Methylocystis sp. TaxID=1911079 RepID=UPI003DA22829
MIQLSKEITGLVRPDNVDAWIESVPEIKGGMLVIKGTRITVHAVKARLLNGDSLDEIAAENPDLPREALAAAVLFAKAHPLPG